MMAHLLLWFAGRGVGCVPCHRLGLRFPFQFVILNLLQWVIFISRSCSLHDFWCNSFYIRQPIIFLKQSLLAWYLLWPNTWNKQLCSCNKQINGINNRSHSRVVCNVTAQTTNYGSLQQIFGSNCLDIYIFVPWEPCQCHSPWRPGAPSSCSPGCCSWSCSPPSSWASWPRSSWWRWVACSPGSCRQVCSSRCSRQEGRGWVSLAQKLKLGKYFIKTCYKLSANCLKTWALLYAITR